MAYTAATAVQFAQRKTGRYGNGECWTLVEDAVVGAGGKSSVGLTPNFGPTSSYVWGTVVSTSTLQAGDVLQFSRYSWTQTTRVDVSNPDGSSRYNVQTHTESRGLPNHSALVVNVVSDGIVEVIEQNIPPGTGPVQTVRLVLAAPATSVVNDPDPPLEGQTQTVTTTTHAVTGTVRCYRPISA